MTDTTITERDAAIVRALIRTARRRKKITYKELSIDAGGPHWRNLSKPLDRVIEICRALGLPNLTALVVEAKSGRCGPGHLVMLPDCDEDDDRQACWTFFTATAL